MKRPKAASRTPQVDREPPDYQNWLFEILPKQERLAKMVRSLLDEMLSQREIEFLNVTCRAKRLDEAISKIQRKNYNDPRNQLTDLSGIRVITFLDAQVKQINDVIRSLFDVDEKNSSNRSTALGADKLGYRSTHFVCTVGKKRAALPEFAPFDGMKFEIQVRTVLQHAWAELAHDRSFKFKAALPPQIERQLYLYAGMLEIVDDAFDKIADEIDKYKVSLQEKTSEQLETAGIDSISLEAFVHESARKNEIQLTQVKASPSIVQAIRDFGIGTIGELKALETPEFITSFKKYLNGIGGLIAYIRVLLMFHDLDRVLSSRDWNWIPPQVVRFLEDRYGKPTVADLIAKHELRIEEFKRPPKSLS